MSDASIQGHPATTWSTSSAAPPETSASLPVLRAAYSDRTAWLMASFARLAYAYPPENCHPGPCPDIPPELSAYGFHRVTYFHNGMTDGWAFVAEGVDLIVVAFRGTKSIKNWETNFQVEMRNPPSTDAQLRVHAGFLNAFNAMSTGKEGLRKAITRIKRENRGTIPIYLTGHSLGGALAQIATAVFGDDQIAACYTFGSPRVGNSYFDLWVKPPSYRIVNYADIVPQIPLLAFQWPLPRIYRHSGDPRYLPNHSQNSPYRYEPGLPTRIWQFGQGLFQLLATFKILGIEDHRIKHYEEKLRRVALARPQSRSSITRAVYDVRLAQSDAGAFPTGAHI